MSAFLEVVSPGMLSTIQDRGRPGRQADGVTPGGAMDPFALQAGNLLLGNEPGAAALEIALRGPTLRVLADGMVCACGADFGAALDGVPLRQWTVAAVRAGQVLSFAAGRDGAWAYLCVPGGIDVPVVMGSRSTHLRAGLGGLDGRALRAGDQLHVAGRDPGGAEVGRALPDALVPRYADSQEVRALPGPQDGLFTRSSLEAFFSTECRVSAQSDRMGYRLAGISLGEARGEVLSAGTALGAVQVPSGGEPIVLMPDRQTTGGYPVIATVIAVDVPVLAQRPPGSIVRFRRGDEAAARAAGQRQREALALLVGRSAP
jgi:antagonist of KipI